MQVACAAIKSIRTVTWCAVLVGVGFIVVLIPEGDMVEVAVIVRAVAVVVLGERAVGRASSISSSRFINEIFDVQVVPGVACVRWG